MHNVLAAARQAERAGDVYATFLRHVEVELPALPKGVTVVLADPRACGCRSDECYFCTAVDDAVYGAAWEEEQAEWRERFGHMFPEWED